MKLYLVLVVFRGTVARTGLFRPSSFFYIRLAFLALLVLMIDKHFKLVEL